MIGTVLRRKQALLRNFTLAGKVTCYFDHKIKSSDSMAAAAAAKAAAGKQNRNLKRDQKFRISCPSLSPKLR